MNDCNFTTTCQTELGGCLTADVYLDQENNYFHSTGCIDNTEACKSI